MSMVAKTHSVLVTGGGTGIGLACAEKFAAQGAAVGLLGRTEAKLVAGRDAILRRHPDADVSLFVGDTADEQTVARADSNEPRLLRSKKCWPMRVSGDCHPLPPKMPINTTRSCGSTPRGRYWSSNMPPEYCLTMAAARCARFPVLRACVPIRTWPHIV